jgi:hypothetical protein
LTCSAIPLHRSAPRPPEPRRSGTPLTHADIWWSAMLRVAVSAPGASTVTSYRVGANGTLDAVSGPIPDGQTAACWLVTSPDGRFAYTTNNGSDNVSSFGITDDGELSLKSAIAATTPARADRRRVHSTWLRALCAVQPRAHHRRVRRRQRQRPARSNRHGQRPTDRSCRTRRQLNSSLPIRPPRPQAAVA